jgi:hypothetical protein
VEVVDGDTYGPLKALCEIEVQEQLQDRCLIIRPGLIVGPHDPTDRFTYWPHRVAHGGRVLAPGHPARPIVHRRSRSRSIGVWQWKPPSVVVSSTPWDPHNPSVWAHYSRPASR